MHLRSRLRTWTALATGVALTAFGAFTALPASAAPQPHAAPVYTIGQFNVGGWDVGQRGTQDKIHAPGWAAPDALVQSIRHRNAAWVSVVEGCDDWDWRLWQQLNSSYDVVETHIYAHPGDEQAHKAPTECWHQPNTGDPTKRSYQTNALVVRKDLWFDAAHPLVYDLGSTVAEQRKMICLTSAGRHLAACAIHLSVGSGSSAGGTSRRHEATVASEILDRLSRRYTISVGGDFNADPMSAGADYFYDQDYGFGAKGGLKEATSPCGNTMKQYYVSGRVILPCRSRGSTFGPWYYNSKIDFIFVDPSIHVAWSSVTHTKVSDHWPVWAGISF
jgi:endonuclease/exonuclease/phosphatase family metal-dependent hydrolase